MNVIIKQSFINNRSFVNNGVPAMLKSKNLKKREENYHIIAHLFARKDYHPTSMRDTVRYMGMNQSSLYHHVRQLGIEFCEKNTRNFSQCWKNQGEPSVKLCKEFSLPIVKAPTLFWRL